MNKSNKHKEWTAYYYYTEINWLNISLLPAHGNAQRADNNNFLF